jgi:hypothetical protein
MVKQLSKPLFSPDKRACIRTTVSFHKPSDFFLGQMSLKKRNYNLAQSANAENVALKQP